MSKPVFPIRLLYAASDRQREKAAELGCNWALEANLAHARNILADLEALKDSLPAKAYRDFKASFDVLNRLVRASGSRRALLFLFWAIKEGRVPFDIDTVRRIEALIEKDPATLKGTA